MGEKSSSVPAAVCIREMMRLKREEVKLKCREEDRRRREGRSRCGYIDVREGPETAVALLIGPGMLSAPLAA